jgi:hypothetical protein
MKLFAFAILFFASLISSAPLIGMSSDCPFGPLTEDLQLVIWVLKLVTLQGGVMDEGGLPDVLGGLVTGGARNSKCVYGG